MDRSPGTDALIADLKSGTVRVLVIDDDPDICMGLKDILLDSGYQVETASCAADGRDHFSQRAYSILVVDYSLPDANGIEIARMVRAQYPWVQTILMTGHDLVEISNNHENSPLLGAFLRKPIDVQTILSVMEQLLHRQCDRFQIARFTPQHEEAPSSYQASAPLEDIGESASGGAAPKQSAYKNKWRMMTIIPVFMVGMAAGWFGHDLLKEQTSSVPVQVWKPELTPIPPAAPPLRVVPIEIPDPDILISKPEVVVPVTAPAPVPAATPPAPTVPTLSTAPATTGELAVDSASEPANHVK